MLAPRPGRQLPLPVWNELISHYLQRDRAPLSAEDWRELDAGVADAAGAARVARRFLARHEAFGPGIKAAATTPEAWKSPDEHGGLTLPILLRDTHINALVPAAALAARAVASCREAATFCARVEDSLVFNGHPDLGYEGLLTASGRQVCPRCDWLACNEATAAADVYAAAGCLDNAGCVGPYALVVGEGLAPALANHRLQEQLAAMVPDLTAHVCPVVPEQAAVLLSPRAEHMDLAVAQDLITGYMGRQAGMHCLRVFSILALRIKHPGAVCILEPGDRPQ